MIVPFNRTHLAEMRMGPGVSVALGGLDPAVTLESLAVLNLATTVKSKDGKTVLGILGAVPLGEDGKTCEIFIISTEDQKKNPIQFTKDVRAEIDRIKGQFARIQAIGEDTPFFTRWFSWLGMTPEGPVVRPEFNGGSRVLWGLRGRG